jgi:DNA-directed RNA polymerase subunit RPC12/RpoP
VTVRNVETQTEDSAFERSSTHVNEEDKVQKKVWNKGCQTEIKNVGSSEELTSMFAQALRVCRNKTGNECPNEDSNVDKSNQSVFVGGPSESNVSSDGDILLQDQNELVMEDNQVMDVDHRSHPNLDQITVNTETKCEETSILGMFNPNLNDVNSVEDLTTQNLEKDECEYDFAAQNTLPLSGDDKLLKKTYFLRKRKRNMNSFDHHTQKHEAANHYKCTWCSKTFTKKDELTRHIQSHTGVRPYKCTRCDKAFANRSNRNRHVQIHTGARVKPYKCTHCNKAFVKKSNRNRHVQIHTGVKPYKCTHCDMAFADKSTRNRHVQIHTGVKPYKCTHCDKVFADKRTRNRHVQIHTGARVKPYKCTHCDKAFVDKSHRNRHVQIHTGVRVKPYKLLIVIRHLLTKVPATVT